MVWFPENWKRLDRALLHLEAFQTEWKRVTGPDAYDLVTEANSDWTAGCLRARRKLPSENTLALELGEFFYQLRAALDSTVYQAALFIEKTDPPSNENRLEFPICEERRWFENSAVHMGPFPDDLKNWLKALQPYRIGEAIDPNQTELISTLRLIHNCARKDRHRQLHVVGAFPTQLRCEFEVSPSTLRVRNGQGVRVNFLESDDPFFFFEIVGADLRQDCHIKLKSHLTMEVSVDQIPIPSGSRFDTEVKKMCAAVDYVVRYFEGGFRL